MEDLRESLVARALASGWAAAGVAALEPFDLERRRALDAIDAGRMDGMEWFTRERVEAAADLRARYPWAQSAIVLAWPYAPARPLDPVADAAEPSSPVGRVSAYACLEDPDGVVDYHDSLRRHCDDLAAWIRETQPGTRVKRFIDHGWALDRALAERAGIGFCGKNTCLITVEAGSYVLIATLLTSLPLPPTKRSHRGCGHCTACLPACPTGALIAPGIMDARRCIAYLTIEHRGAIPVELRPLIGTWVFGCDLCQEACPINQRLAPAPIAQPEPGDRRGPVAFPELLDLLSLDDAEFDRRYRRTAIARTGRNGLVRNAAIALGNAGDVAAVPALRRVAASDTDAVVREAAAWAAERLSTAAAEATA